MSPPWLENLHRKRTNRMSRQHTSAEHGQQPAALCTHEDGAFMSSIILMMSASKKDAL